MAETANSCWADEPSRLISPPTIVPTGTTNSPPIVGVPALD